MKLGILVIGMAILSPAFAGQAAMKSMKPKMQPRTAPTMDKAMWQKNYDKAAKMFEAGKVDEAYKWMTPDFTMKSMGKTENLAQSKKSMMDFHHMMKDLHVKFTVNGVRGSGNMVMVMTDSKFWGTMNGSGKDKHSHKMVSTGTGVDTWVKGKNGQWMMKSIVMSHESGTMDGKPMKMGG